MCRNRHVVAAAGGVRIEQIGRSGVSPNFGHEQVADNGGNGTVAPPHMADAQRLHSA
jgi:hypothetical protein